MAEPPGRDLAALVRAEAARAEAEEHFPADPALLGQGWVRRFVTDERRAEEAAELYRSLGLDVRLEPAVERAEGDCGSCQLVSALRFRMIYTRARSL